MTARLLSEGTELHQQHAICQMCIRDRYVSHIVYRNSDNGYTVFHIEHDDGEVTCVGSLNYINEGERCV